MYKIVNNKIYIGRGETPTYDVLVANRDGSPFKIFKTARDVEGDKTYIEFVVRKSIYSDDITFRYFIDQSDKKVFDSDTIILVDSFVGLGQPEVEFINHLHHTYYIDIVTKEEVNQYKYWDTDKWVDYEFRLTFPFQYGDTAHLENKTYWYEVTVMKGVLKNPLPDNKESPYTSISYKKILQDPTEFILGGSISE